MSEIQTKRFVDKKVGRPTVKKMKAFITLDPGGVPKTRAVQMPHASLSHFPFL
jgi:hypothetical protein